jgi:hypothetical protein
LFIELANDATTQAEEPAVGVCGYCFIIRADAWHEFCLELGLGGAAASAFLAEEGRGPAMAAIEAIMRQAAFTAEQAVEALKARNMDDSKPVTVDSLISTWRQYVEGLR